MKRFVLWSMVLVLLLSFCGCKRADDELAQTGDHAVINAAGSSTEENADSQEPQEYPSSLTERKNKLIEAPAGDVISPENKEKWNESDLNQWFDTPPTLQKLTNSQLDGIQKEVTDDEIILRFHPDLRAALPRAGIYSYPGNGCFLRVELTYDLMMSSIGEDGIIVAGYTDGLRERHSKISNSDHGYTLANFVVTDQYYGPKAPDTITITENAQLMINQDLYACIGTTGGNGRYFENGQPYLLYLSKGPDAPIYYSQFTIPLSADYRDYSETYLTDILDFFSGEESQYAAYADFRWPKQEISAEALPEELNKNIILRTITEYNVVIWPYGHKKFKDMERRNSNFIDVSIP